MELIVLLDGRVFQEDDHGDSLLSCMHAIHTQYNVHSSTHTPYFFKDAMMAVVLWLFVTKLVNIVALHTLYKSTIIHPEAMCIPSSPPCHRHHESLR